jgi:3-methyladenine DNA glycosylase AlkD
MTATASFVLSEIQSVANPEKAKFLQRFFKTGKGQYAEGDIMLGLTMPIMHNIVKHAPALPLSEVQILLDSPYHDARMAGFLLLLRQFRSAKQPAERQVIYDFYLNNARRANNWDLVDLSCRDIVGGYLLDKPDRSILYALAASDNLWEQRIAMVSTWMFIKHGQYDDTLSLAVKLIDHKHDLIHKATGWMLREVGKRSRMVLTGFLESYRKQLPRTALRYAIEHFSAEEKAFFMQK